MPGGRRVAVCAELDPHVAGRFGATSTSASAPAAAARILVKRVRVMVPRVTIRTAVCRRRRRVWREPLLLLYPHGMPARFDPRGRFLRAGDLVNGYVLDHFEHRGLRSGRRSSAGR